MVLNGDLIRSLFIKFYSSKKLCRQNVKSYATVELYLFTINFNFVYTAIPIRIHTADAIVYIPSKIKSKSQMKFIFVCGKVLMYKRYNKLLR